MVIWTPPSGLRLGNLLYVWLQAHHRQAAGEDVRVLRVPAMEEWLERFPSLRELSIAREDVRFADRRQWDSAWQYQRFGVDFTRAQLQAFARQVFADRLGNSAEDRLVVNVRRGDFYGTPFEAKHGFEIVPYVEAALSCFPDKEHALIVSDDPEWCRTHIQELVQARGGTVAYATPHAEDNLFALARSEAIIGANSTFSYWGAYLADAFHDGARIVMPRFHARMAQGSDAFQLDPRWVSLEGFC